MEVYGEFTRKVYRLGEKVNVVLLDTDRIMRTIDFRFAGSGELPEEEEPEENV